MKATFDLRYIRTLSRTCSHVSAHGVSFARTIATVEERMMKKKLTEERMTTKTIDSGTHTFPYSCNCQQSRRHRRHHHHHHHRCRCVGHVVSWQSRRSVVSSSVGRARVVVRSCSSSSRFHVGRGQVSWSQFVRVSAVLVDRRRPIRVCRPLKT